ncbi:MAG: ABC transporter ATP-binding protein [Pseudomonadota bacterium]|nr:ABC transporter ATP-binding protein [Pseudomonadota bacterium]
MDKRATSPILVLRDLHLGFHQGTRTVDVLKGAAGEVEPGEAVALLGPSGAGKSTLLHLIGLLEAPDSGSIIIEGEDCGRMSDGERTRVRREKLGFVYQFHHLLPEFSAIENVILPQLILGRSWSESESRAHELLVSLGLSERMDHRPAELSGGEQQRVAIARAVANRPCLLLADEPTGNLDPETAERVFQQLIKLVKGAGLTAIIATHNLDLAARMSRIWRLEAGQIVEQVGARR